MVKMTEYPRYQVTPTLSEQDKVLKHVLLIGFGSFEHMRTVTLKHRFENAGIIVNTVGKIIKPYFLNKFV